MKKKVMLSLCIYVAISLCYSQVIEKLGETGSLKFSETMVTRYPSDTYVDEVNEMIYCKASKRLERGIIKFSDNLEIEIQGTDNARTATSTFYKTGDYEIHCSDIAIEIKNSDKIIRNLAISTGISFIVKKGSGYIVYYVDKTGKPGAVDTEGVIYTSEEAMGYLKEYDSEKYAQSLARAEELGLKQKFLNSEVLVWGRTYYSTLDILTAYWKPETYLYGNGSQPIQYDMQGNGYGANIRPQGVNSNICINNPDGQRIVRILIQDKSTILTETEKKKNEFSSSWYVGFGGNIYYYIAGEDYTEVFRIRRTWGEPDFYAMAINGWTDDDYGDYVESVLPTLSAADLRLLRNTVFALYGYHFNSADLAAHFDKQVWYTDDGKTTADITLPEHRARLVEMIQALETQ